MRGFLAQEGKTSLRHLFDTLTTLGLFLLASAVIAAVCELTDIGELSGISGSSDTNVIAVGKGGDIVQFNGTAWTQATSPTAKDLRDVVVLDTNTAYAVGKKEGGNATVLEYNGASWSSINISGVNKDLNAVWAYDSPNGVEVYVVGKNGTLYWYDGSTWRNVGDDSGSSAAGKELKNAFGDSAYFYALAKDGTIYQFDRSATFAPENSAKWSTISTCTGIAGDVRGLWGDGTNLWISEHGGKIYTLLADGTGTCDLQHTAASNVDALFGFENGTSGESEITATGHGGTVAISLDSGASWTDSTDGTKDLEDVWVSGTGKTFYSGKNGSVTDCDGGTGGEACEVFTIPSTKELKGISGCSDTNVIAVGKAGEIFEFDGTGITAMSSTTPNTKDLEDVWVEACAYTAYAVGKKQGGSKDGTVLRLNGDNTATWTEDIYIPALNKDLLTVWANSTHVYVGGKNGTLQICTLSLLPANCWSDESGAADANTGGVEIKGSFGDSTYYYGLGKDGTIFRHTLGSSTWATNTKCTGISGGNDFRGIWGDGTDLWISEHGGEIWKIDINGTGTCTLQHTASKNIDDIFGSSVTGDIFASGHNGTVAHFDGSTWSDSTEGTKDLEAIWVSDTGNPFYAGKGGQITVCPPDTDVAHYAISYPNGTPGVTCEAQAVRVTAHDSSESAVVVPSTTTITVSTAPAADSWSLDAGGGTFTPGVGGSATYLFSGSESFVDLFLTETTATTSPHIDIDVDDGTATDIDGSATEDANIQFADAVFRFFADAVGEGIGTQIAGKESDLAPGNQTIQLRSVQTSTSTGACEAGILNTQTIEMAYKCNNPITCQAAPRVQIVDTYSITPGNDNSDTVDATNGNFDNVDLDFGTTGTATFSLDFNDAGQIQLFARKAVAASPPDPAFTLFGSSNLFVVRPFGFDIDSGGLRAADWIDNNVLDDSTSTNLSYAADADGSVFASAGHSSNTFSVSLRSVLWQSTDDGDNDGVPDSGVDLTDNSTTPNFGQETANSELVDVTSSNVQPTNVGSLFFGDNLDFVNGTITTNLAFDEVGIIDLTAALDTGDYLSSGSDVTATHQNFGRFIPDRFTLANNTPTLENSCVAGNFTYMEESFYYGSGNEPAITLTAVNEAGGTTVNYGDGGTPPTDYWKLPTALDHTYDDNGVNSNTTFIDLAVASVSVTGDNDFDGIGVLTLSNVPGDRDSFMFDRDSVDIGASEGAPFTASIDLLLQVTAGSLTDTDGVCYDGDSDGICEIDGSDDYTALTDTGGTALSLNQLRFGRFTIGTAVGSELLTLNPPLITEYFDGTGFLLNTDDSCTALVLADHILLDNTGTRVAGNTSMTIGGGTTSITTFNSPLDSGDTDTEFSAPGSGNTGFVDIFGNLGCNDVTVICGGSTTFDHLRYDWDDDDDNDDGPYDDEPIGRIDFGLFEGPKSQIYSREPW